MVDGFGILTVCNSVYVACFLEHRIESWSWKLEKGTVG